MSDNVNPETGEVITSLDMPKPLAEAVTQVMARVGKIAKEQKNQHGGYNFASVDAFLEAVQPACSEAGLWIVQDEENFEIRDGWLVLQYRFTLGHKSGAVWAHQPKRTIMVNAKQGSQAFGAAQSYALKQFMRSLFQIATGDQEDADTHPQTNLPAQNSQAQPAKTYGGTAKRGEQAQVNRVKIDPPEKPDAVPVPAPGDGQTSDQVWRAWAAVYKTCIHSAPDVETVNEWEQANESQLAQLAKHSTQAEKHLRDAAEKMRGNLSQQPHPEAEYDPTQKGAA